MDEYDRRNDEDYYDRDEDDEVGRRRRRRRPADLRDDGDDRPRRRRRRRRRGRRSETRRRPLPGGPPERAKRGRWVERRGKRVWVEEERPAETEPEGDAPPEEAEVDEVIEEIITEVLSDPEDEEAAAELGARLRRGWGPITRISNSLRLQARNGVKTAVMEVKPGLWCVAEIPEGVMRDRPDEFGGAVKVATRITEALRDAVTKPPRNEAIVRTGCRCRWENE